MAPARDKQLEILGGASTGRHGWELLWRQRSRLYPAATVADFVSARTHSQLIITQSVVMGTGLGMMLARPVPEVRLASPW